MRRPGPSRALWQQHPSASVCEPPIASQRPSSRVDPIPISYMMHTCHACKLWRRRLSACCLSACRCLQTASTSRVLDLFPSRPVQDSIQDILSGGHRSQLITRTTECMNKFKTTCMHVCTHLLLASACSKTQAASDLAGRRC